MKALSYAISLEGFEQHGDRRAVYEALIASLPASGKYSAPDRLDRALAVAGFGPYAAGTLVHYWPGQDHRPLFSDPREYLPRILTIAAASPHGRFRAVAVDAMPLLTRAEFSTWGFDDTTMPLPQRAMIAARLGEAELFAAMVGALEERAAERGRSIFIFSPPLTLDYQVGPKGPFIYSPCGGKGDRSQRVTVEQLCLALVIPFDVPSEEHSRRFHAIFGDWRPDQLDLGFPFGDES